MNLQKHTTIMSTGKCGEHYYENITHAKIDLKNVQTAAKPHKQRTHKYICIHDGFTRE